MIILLTGKPGSGKSYLIQELIKELKTKNIAGIISPEIRDKERKGFKIIDLVTKKEEILASVNIKSNIRVSKYGVNVNGIDKIVDLFLKSFEKADYIFIDEIGKMELYSKKFKDMINKVFNSNKTIIAVIHRNLVNKYKGELFWVEKENISNIKKKILEKIKPSL